MGPGRKRAMGEDVLVYMCREAAVDGNEIGPTDARAVG